MTDLEMEVYKIPGVDAFTATNVLTPEECADFVRSSEAAGFRRSGEGGGPHFAGNRTRATLTDERLSQRLFSRLEPYLAPIRHRDAKPWYFDFLGPLVPSGTYVPVGVNDFMRVSRYVPGGKFRDHRDTGYVRDDQYVGFWTLLLYLNDDFEGGETTIYDESNGKLAHTVKPEVGKVFAFYHFQMHAGLEVTSGSKLVARTEIMYARQETAADRLVS
jgi:hypothetical protein